MRSRAFTLIEVMAVVTLLGLLAGATAWSLADDARRSARADLVGQIAHMDSLARRAGRLSGRPALLRIDMDAQSLWRVDRDGEGAEEATHALRLPTHDRIVRVMIPSAAVQSQQGAAEVGVRKLDSGVVEIAYSTGGRSMTFAVELQDGDSGVKQWLVFSGLTGQMTKIDHEDELDNLLSLVATGRPDAD